jgi:hypothetical protein
MVFDPNQKNVAPMYLGRVRNGAVTYRIATMEKPSAVGQTPLARPPAVGQTPLTRLEPEGPPREPYARVGEDGVGYAGPHRADMPPGPVSVILFGPSAAEIAQSPEMRTELAASARQGQTWKLLPVESGQNWGAASTQLVHALMDEYALAILALDRNASHLAEQLALKTFVPVIALSSDKTLTSTNVPWIFRLPAATQPAAALRMLEAAEGRSGANPERLRDALASGRDLAGVAFLTNGEPR